MKKKRTFIIVLVIVVVLILAALATCRKKGNEPVSGNGSEEIQTVMVEELQPRFLNEYINVSGKLEGSTDLMMVSETSGRILKLYKKLGDRVKIGERLGIVDNEIYRIQLDQAEAAKLSAESALENAKLNLSAAEVLFQRQATSEAEYNSSITAYKTAKAAADGAKAAYETARRNYDNSFLVAPITGTISKLIAVENQYINYGTQVAYITDNQNLVIKTGVGESQITKLKPGQNVEINIPGTDRKVQGVISGLGNRPLPGAANYSLEIRLLSSNGLQSGMVVTAKILSGVYKDQYYTSINNIYKEYDRNYLYTIDNNNKVVRKEIQIGKVIGENVMILNGAEAGDRIVTTGAENLEDGASVQVRS